MSQEEALFLCSLFVNNVIIYNAVFCGESRGNIRKCRSFSEQDALYCLNAAKIRKFMLLLCTNLNYENIDKKLLTKSKHRC